MKVVAVSQRVEIHADRGERRDALDQRLGAWLAGAAYLAMPVPNALIAPSAASADHRFALLRTWLLSVAPAAVVLSGGNDLGECPERDLTEGYLLSWAGERRIPVLGICRGMQMMAVRAGGRLKAVAGHAHARHTLHGRMSGEANSFHRFGLAACPPDFEVLAAAEDGGLEAIRHAVLPWEAWMWHPEREADFDRRDLERLRALFN